MAKREPTRITAGHGEAGFTLIELLMVIVIVMIAAGMAAMVIADVLPTIHADSALEMVVAQLQQAHQDAINQRRNFLVTFAGTNELTISRVNLDGTETQVADYFLAQGMTYAVVTGVPDTPDGFGAGIAVNFAGGNTITLNSDGTAVDSSGRLVNGTLFMAIAGKATSARAVTVMGATGRVKGYRYNGSAWN